VAWDAQPQLVIVRQSQWARLSHDPVVRQSGLGNFLALSIRYFEFNLLRVERDFDRRRRIGNILQL
jgi:hypothetical protein